MKRNLSLLLAIGLATVLAAPGLLRAQSPTPSPTPAPTVMFGVTFFGNELETIDPATGVATKVASLEQTVSPYGIAARGGRLFTFDPNINRIREINRATGRIIRDIDIGVTGLAGEGDLAFRADGVGFLVSALDGKTTAFPPTNDIYTFNVDNGTSQRIGTTGVPIDGLAFDPNGTLYGIGEGDATLYTINQANGVATAVGSLGVAMNSPISAIAFSPSGTLFASIDDRLYQVNKATGAATPVSATVLDFGVSSVSGLAFGPGAGTLGNMSTRAAVGTGENVGIGGFIIRGTAPKRVLVRGIGPSLTSLSGALPDPVLELFNNQMVSLTRNDNWRDSAQAAEIAASGLAPSNDKESAILQTLPAAAYTAVLSGAGGATGIGVVETFDLDPGSGSQLGNISTRGLVQGGDRILIGGVIISGSAPQRLAFRAIGPDLSRFGVSNPLPNPTLDIRDANGQSIGSNDDYKSANQTAELARFGLTPGDDRDSALITDLAPGLYTALVSGAGNSSGVALVEIYDLSGNNQ